MDSDYGLVLNDNDKWGKDGPPQGCLMTVGVVALVITMAVISIALSFVFVVPAVQSLWQR